MSKKKGRKNIYLFFFSQKKNKSRDPLKQREDGVHSTESSRIMRYKGKGSGRAR